MCENIDSVRVDKKEHILMKQLQGNSGQKIGDNVILKVNSEIDAKCMAKRKKLKVKCQKFENEHQQEWKTMKCICALLYMSKHYVLHIVE